MLEHLLLLIVLSFCGCNNDQEFIEIPEQDYNEAITVFRELKETLKKEKGQTWGFSLEGPIMLVNRDTRTIIANEKDDSGELIKRGPVFVGKLPENVNIANTALEWNGKRWTMVAFPLPEKEDERLSLLIHESFHRIQPEIGFDSLNEIQSAHLDSKDGRIYLKLELEALKEALNSNESDSHIENALLFREYRYQLFPGAKNAENTLELNEGLAEYTGSLLSQRTESDLKAHYIANIELFYTFPTFVRSFPYFTIPVYGYFMQKTDNQWNLRITKETNLTDFISEYFDFSKPEPVDDVILRLGKSYGLNAIVDNETEREEKKEKLKNKYRSIFLGDSIVEIELENMNISFNPRDIMPLDSLGSVYPMLRITDNWGILEVDSCGALLSPEWNKVTISFPESVSDSLILGKGWRLILNESWKMKKSGVSYQLKKDLRDQKGSDHYH